MSKYKILSIAIILVSITISLAIIMVGYEKSQELSAYQTSLLLKGNKSVSVDVLNPSALNSMSGGSAQLMLVIPKLGVNAVIRSDTVNAYNSVYHYPESVDPGQNGEVGLLGHRTTYSALFKNIGTLNPGDEIIVKDLTNSKKYVYKVTSNGNDIRWDYKENPVQFAQSGEPRLLILTCYPPGRKQAAYILHSKLASTSAL